jgi:aspartyl-tRNA(Asn)/glutamyl-tRNA(Gln) amidotransferase subunit A
VSDAAASLEPDGVAVAEAIRAGTASASEICEAALVGAAAAPGMFWSIDADRARADAAAIDRDRADGRLLGPLGGVPIAVKDNYEVAGVSSTMGLAAPLTDAPSTDAEAVARLRGAGAIVIGTTAMDQLAWSMNGTAPDRPELDNPAAPGRVTGGSSGGSAAAVAAGIVPVALGSDTAGSVRLPAAWCGVLGFKPTRGVVSLRGVAPLAPSLDTAGVLTRSARDQIAVLQVLAGIDLPGPLPPPRCAVVTDGVGWFDTVVDVFAGTDWRLTKRVQTRPRPRLGQILASEFATAWSDRLSPEQVSSDVWAGIERGRALDAGDVRSDRDALMVSERAARRMFQFASLLITPTVEGPAPAFGQEVSVAEASRSTRPLSAFGWPCISIPCGTIDGCPVGVQLVAAPGDDARLLGWAAQAVAMLATPETQHA